jgi:hypothetical protein
MLQHNLFDVWVHRGQSLQGLLRNYCLIYVCTYGIYSEQVDFQDVASWERNMDDLILRAAIWQEEHWID